MLKIISLLLAVALWSATGHAQTADNRFGLGIILGEPTGFSAQAQISSTERINSTLAYSFDSWVQFSADYVFLRRQYVASVLQRPSPLDAYFGIGVVLGTATVNKHEANPLGLGMRIPFGLEWYLAAERVGLFFELVPGMRAAPDTGFLFQGAFGARYFF